MNPPAGATVRFRDLGELRPFEGNARTHSDAQVLEIVASIERFGWTNPILADAEGNIAAGHGRRLAALALYERGGTIRFPGTGGVSLPKNTVPVIDCTGWSENERRAYTLADNQLALNAGWDLSTLRGELEAIEAGGSEISGLGFSDKQLSAVLKSVFGAAGADEVPPVPERPISRRGDLWHLGEHRLLCGDSTKADDVARVLAGERPHLMVTDPPYGVNYDPKWRTAPKFKAGRRGTKGQPLKDNAYAALGKVGNDDRADWREAWALFPGEVAYVWCAAGPLQVTSHDSLFAVGLIPRYQIIWAKPHFALGRGDYHWQHEPCWYAVREGGESHWNGARDQATIWAINSNMGFTSKTTGKDARTGHSTQKPVECMRRPIVNNSKPGEAVYEPFAGSGSTIIAGEMEGRRVLSIELAPEYVDVAVRRWETFVQGTARLDGGGSFAEVAAARTAPPPKKRAAKLS